MSQPQYTLVPSSSGRASREAKWWWNAGPVSSCCFCCTLSGGVGFLAVLEIISGASSSFSSRGLPAVLALTSIVREEMEEACAPGMPQGEDSECAALRETVESMESQIEALSSLMKSPFFQFYSMFIATAALVAGIIGLWAVTRRSAGAAKIYSRYFVLKMVVGSVTMVTGTGMPSRGLISSGGASFPSFLVTMVLNAYFCKVVWSFHKVVEDEAVTARLEANGPPIIGIPMEPPRGGAVVPGEYTA